MFSYNLFRVRLIDCIWNLTSFRIWTNSYSKRTSWLIMDSVGCFRSWITMYRKVLFVFIWLWSEFISNYYSALLPLTYYAERTLFKLGCSSEFLRELFKLILKGFTERDLANFACFDYTSGLLAVSDLFASTGRLLLETFYSFGVDFFVWLDNIIKYFNLTNNFLPFD